MARLMDDTD
jgi:nascent polypeptide-associated complex subunit alpha